MNKPRRLHGLRLPSSLGARLLLFIGLAIALLAVLQGALAYRNALVQTYTLFDYQMQQTAFALRAGLPVDAKGRPEGTPPEDENDEFIVQVWTNEGLRIFESALGAALPQMAVLGFADVPARGTTYRVFSLPAACGFAAASAGAGGVVGGAPVPAASTEGEGRAITASAAGLGCSESRRSA